MPDPWVSIDSYYTYTFTDPLTTDYVGEVSNTTFLSKIQDTIVVHSQVEIEDDEPTVSLARSRG